LEEHKHIPVVIYATGLDSLGKYTGALTYLDKALDIDPNYKPALNYKGFALRYRS
jgi:tetratricopeptide (TPR) repeat protein